MEGARAVGLGRRGGPAPPAPAPAGPSWAGVAADLAADPRAVHRIRLPARSGCRSEWPGWLNPRVRAAYEQRGIPQPWRHQAAAAELAWRGEHVIVATGTASGKTAAFGMPALTAALAPPAGHGRGPGVLYLAPTKALAHDQLAGLAGLNLPGLRAAAVDGDASDDERAWARAHARWIVTNPDMLHRSILPGHERWRSFLGSLRFVVVDEAHVYRGVFGSHVALVLRRLLRICGRYGAAPTVLLASATVAGPGATAARLLGTDVAVVDTDDSARGALDILLWTSPDDGAGRAEDPAPASTLSECAGIVSRLVDAGAATLAFARSRRGVEVVAAAVRERAREGARVRAYRGGYLPEERRALEADLRSGRLLGLAATNALELGIDISGLDAVVLAGWPGTRASFWQQVGRAGRTGGGALAVLVAREDPLDQYLVRHPDAIVGTSVEATVLDPANPYVLAGHLCAAAAEAPLGDAELGGWFGQGAADLCAVLADRGLLRRRRDGWYWTSSARAADLVDLRGSAGGPVRVVEEGTGRLLGTVDPATAPSVVHDGAIYVHQGAAFEVLELDLGSRVATAAPTVTDLSTHARGHSDVQFEQVRTRRQWGAAEMACGEVLLTSRVTSYLVRRWPSGQVIAEHPLDLPALTLHTTAAWWTIPDGMLAGAGIADSRVPGALHALEHAAIGILPLLATCDRWDIGGVSTARHPQTGMATIVVHDGQAGGAGFAERGFHEAVAWLAATCEAIAACRCASGCPACIQSPKCGNGNEPLDKDAALALGRALVAAAPTPAPGGPRVSPAAG